MEGLINFIIHLGWIAVLFVIFAETGLMAGFFFPGDSLLFTAGFLVHEHILDINIHIFVVLLFAASVLGNSTGYLFGSRVGRKLFERDENRFFKRKYLLSAEKFYERNGRKTIVLAMFVPIIRTFTPIVAGITHMPFRTFIKFNLLGAILWTASFTYLGYFAGAAIKRFGLNIEATALIIIFLSLLPGIIHVLREKENRERLKSYAGSLLRRRNTTHKK